MHPLSLPPSSRYELLLRLAAGGTATVYVGRLRGGAGFSRLVAIKRAHHHLVSDPSFRGALLREARITAQLCHPNVVSIVDVEEVDGEILLIMDYVEGASLASLVASAGVAPLARTRASLRVLIDACAGLDAAHHALDEWGRPFGLVHRDVSPQNILVGVNGVGRLIDFGIAKVSSLRSGHTGLSLLKGKVSYMAPEYLQGETLDARSDVFGAGVVLWEALTGCRLFKATNEYDTLKRILEYEAPPVSSLAPGLPPELDRAVGRALAKSRAERYESARAFGEALEAVARSSGLLATHAEVGELVAKQAGEAIEKTRRALRSLAGPPAEDPVDSTPIIEVETTLTEEDWRGEGRGDGRETMAPPPAGAPGPPDETAGPALLSTTADDLRLLRSGGRKRALVSGGLALGLVAVIAAVASAGRGDGAGESSGAGAPSTAVGVSPSFDAAPAPPPDEPRRVDVGSPPAAPSAQPAPRASGGGRSPLTNGRPLWRAPAGASKISSDQRSTPPPANPYRSRR